MRRGIRPVATTWDLRTGRHDNRRTGRLRIRFPFWLHDGIRLNRILSRDDSLRLVRRNDNNHWN